MMTEKIQEEAETGKMSSGPSEGVQTVPKETRHLAVGATMTTLCGLAREGLQTAHPSKARKTDCAACREAYRLGREQGTPRPEGFKVGDYVEQLDGSAWEVLDKTKSSAKVKCVVGSSFHPKGQVTNISTNSPLRVFTTEEFVALVKRQETPAVVASDEPKKPRSTGKWAPTAEDVARVKELRAAGNSYIAIETAMGWPEGHGNRPWRIVTGKLLAREVAK